MPDFILILAAISILLAVGAYIKAHKLHHAIEELSPGFNSLMRCKWRKRP